MSLVKRTFYISYIAVIILYVSPILSKNACEKTFDGNRCHRLQDKTCLTSDLTYNFTSSILVSGLYRDLKLWENLKHVPKCWNAIRPVLCAVYLPRCDYDDTINKSLVQLPKKKMCDFMKGPCKIVEELNLWPIYLNCSYYYYSEGCHDNTADLKFSQTGSCKYPLIKTNNSLSWYTGFEDCAFSCQNAWFTDEEHAKVHFTILVFCLCCITCNLFAVLTFGCNWKRLSNFPDIIILYMNVCFMVSSLGWLFQFIPNVRNSVVCKLDGTPKRAESQFKSDESPLCIIVFIIIYFFTLASVAWLVVLTYTWQVAFETSRGQVKKRKAYFHMGVWVLSIVLTVLCLAFAEIDGNTLTGICFVGSDNYHSRGIFILTPMVVSWIAGVAFLVRGMLLLINMKSQSPDLLSVHKVMKLRSSIVRIGFFLSTLILFGIIAFGLHIYDFINLNTWKTSMRNYVICTSNLTGKAGASSDCLIKNKPSIGAIQLSLFCYFGFGVLLSSWLWRMAAFKSWKYCLMSCLHPCCCSNDYHGTLGLMKNEQTILNTISETDDLIGMDFDLNSMTSFDVSSLSSILTSNRRHSDSDVSSFEKKLFRSTKNHVSKETFMKTNGASSLSSSEWSGSESQNSHFSISSPIYQHFKMSEANSMGFHASNAFIIESSKVEKNDGFVKGHLIQNTRKSSIGNISTALKYLIKDVAMQKRLAYFALDLHSFIVQTKAMYEDIEDNVVQSKLTVDIFDYDYSARSDECETLDSSNSNYTLASSDSDVLSIKVDWDHQPIAASIDSLINETSKKAYATEFLGLPHQDILTSDSNHVCCSYYLMRAFPKRRPCRPCESNMLHINSRSDTSDSIRINEAIICQIHPDSDVLSDKCSIGDMSIISIVQESNDGDESGNVSDLAQSFKKDLTRVSLIRRKRFLTLNRN